MHCRLVQAVAVMSLPRCVLSVDWRLPESAPGVPNVTPYYHWGTTIRRKIEKNKGIYNSSSSGHHAILDIIAVISLPRCILSVDGRLPESAAEIFNGKIRAPDRVNFLFGFDELDHLYWAKFRLYRLKANEYITQTAILFASASCLFYSCIYSTLSFEEL